MSLEVKVYNLDGKPADTISLNEKIFSAKINKGLLHSAVLYFLANRRSSSANTLTKSEVRGGGRKPYQQKHTGRARRGSSRSPLMVGGGVSMGPKTHAFETKLTKSMKKAALRSALTDRKAQMTVLSNFEIKEPKTKAFVKVMDNFKLNETALFIDANIPENFSRASRNVSTIKAINLGSINVYEILKYNKLFITKDAVKKLEETLA